MIKKIFIFFILFLSFFQNTHCRAEFTRHTLPDGAYLRTGSWASKTLPSKGVVILLVGRASFMEKNLAFIQELNDRGYDVESFDWRGHGGSFRLQNMGQKCHVASFDQYLSDLHHYLTYHVSPRHGPPWLMIGASMGGLVGLHYAHAYPQNIKKLSLVAPMLEVFTKPFPRWTVSPIVRTMDLIGFGDSYAFGYGPVKLDGPIPDKLGETHDRDEHIKTHHIMRAHPDFVVGGPTFAWVSASLDAMNKAHETRPPMPVFMHLAGEDRIVDNRVSLDLCKKMPKCQSKIYEGSFHNITKEIPSIRSVFIHDLDEFLSGTFAQETSNDQKG